MAKSDKKTIAKKYSSKTETKGKGKNYKKNRDSDSSSSESGSDSESDGEQMDEHEYRKFISKMFPSKHIDKKVKAGERVKQKLAKYVEEEEEDTGDEEEVWETESDDSDYVEEKEKEKEKEKHSKKNKKSKAKKQKKRDLEEDYEEDEEDEVDDKKVNIVFTIGAPDDEDDYYDDDEEEETESDTEDEDASVSSDDDTDEDEEEEEDDEEEEEEEVVCTRSKSCCKKNKSVKEDKTQKKKQGKGKDVPPPPPDEQISSESDETDEQFLVRLQEMAKTAGGKNNKMLMSCIETCKANIEQKQKKVEKKSKKQKAKNMRIFKKITKDKNTNNDFTFYEKLDAEKQKKIIKEMKEINKNTRVEKPYRMTLLEADIPVAIKSVAMKKVNMLRYMDPGSGEYYKNKTWVDTFMKIPFNKSTPLPVSIEDGVDKCHDFMENAKKTLDEAVFGLNDAKMQIMQMLGQLIVNPSSVGSAIGIHGAPGTGKTSLVKDGIAKILGRKTVFIPCGGLKDSSTFIGHGFTYEGAMHGAIVQGLIANDSDSVVFVFDEVDKLNEEKGQDIAGVFTHLIDTTQNHQFSDEYFAGVPFNLSKCVFIFSYNDPNAVNPILRDRMYKIQTKGYDEKEKTIICNDYMLPKIRDQLKFKTGDIIIPDNVIHHIIEAFCEKEEGVRNMKRCMEIIHTKLNLYRLMKSGTNLFKEDNSLKVEFPFTLTNEIVDKLLKKSASDKSCFSNSMYL
jgi:ATP-dependent Lon protease